MTPVPSQQPTSTYNEPLPDRLVAFVGAGISHSAGLPLFPSLREELYHDVLKWRLLTPTARRRLQGALNLLAPEYSISLLDRPGEDPRGYVCSRMSVGVPAEEHHLLASALDQGAIVYTPNFDTLIEQAARDRPFVTASVTRAGGGPGQARLLKLHGSCPDILVSAEDVLAPVDPLWSTRFLHDCSRPDTTLLVWGFRGVDPDLTPLVVQGAQAAARCVWIAYSDDDAKRSQELLEAIPHATALSAHENENEVWRMARESLGATAPRRDHASTPTPPRSEHHDYRIRRKATRASAISHLGSARLGKLAWLEVALSGDRTGWKQLIRSCLFDIRFVQALTIPLLARRLSRGLGPGKVNVLLTAMEGRGVRADDDSTIQQLLEIRPFGNQLSSMETRARLATHLRTRGRLSAAEDLLDEIAHDAKSRDALNATWRGRLTYERAITQRLAGNLSAAEQTLRSVETAATSVVGANWSMWLEDEWCALAIEKEDAAAARTHLHRARQLAAAPLRKAWLTGLRADAARRNGDTDTAAEVYARLTSSPHLPH
jgi:hypothetical protein